MSGTVTTLRMAHLVAILKPVLLEGNVFWWQVFPQTCQGRCGFFIAWSMSGAETVDSDTSLSSAGPRKTFLRRQSDIHIPSVTITAPVLTLIKAAGRDTSAFHLPSTGF